MDVIDLVAREYLQLQSIHESFDQRALLIKGWSVTVCLAGVAKGVESRNPTVLKLSAAAGLLFWLIEAIWKTFQGSFEARIIQIEEAFRTENPAEAIGHPLQIYTEWGASWSAAWWYEVPLHMIQPPVFLPHAIAVGIALLMIRKWSATASTA